MGRESACWNAGGVNEVAPAVCEGMAAVRLEGELVEGEGEESEAAGREFLRRADRAEH